MLHSASDWASCYEHGNEPSGSIKGGEFIDKLSDCQLLKKDSASFLLTPWCRTFFEKLIVTQLVKQYPAFFVETDGSLLC
jgi:hypothetical protein